MILVAARWSKLASPVRIGDPNMLERSDRLRLRKLLPIFAALSASQDINRYQ